MKDDRADALRKTEVMQKLHDVSALSARVHHSSAHSTEVWDGNARW
jgi:hypothetical protein